MTAVIDGDTIELGNGTRVRLVQIDAPEPGEGECFGREATAILSSILPRGTKVRLVADPALDEVDRYGRLLRYVFTEKRNVNVLLVQRGAASVWFFQGERGRFAERLLRAARSAKAAGRGLWGACPGTRLDPTGPIDTSSRADPRSSSPSPGGAAARPGWPVVPSVPPGSVSRSVHVRLRLPGR